MKIKILLLLIANYYIFAQYSSENNIIPSASGNSSGGNYSNYSIVAEPLVGTQIQSNSNDYNGYFWGLGFFMLPTIFTSSVNDITLNSVTCGGNVTNDGGASVTARGVCWNTTGTPTIADSKTTDGSGIGTFTSSISGLTQSTLYYVRAYATNSQGTSYGEERMFTTIPTLPEWGLIIFGSLIAFFAVRKILQSV